MATGAGEGKTGLGHAWGVPLIADLPASCPGKARRRIGTYGKLKQRGMWAVLSHGMSGCAKPALPFYTLLLGGI